MQIERLTAGEYAVTDGERLISLKKGLNRKWDVTPIVGVDGKPRTVRSYGDAKLTAEAMMRGEASAKPGTSQPKRARTKASPTLPERLRALADELEHVPVN